MLFHAFFIYFLYYILYSRKSMLSNYIQSRPRNGNNSNTCAVQDKKRNRVEAKAF